jgi:prepilin-type N-terminal cleavage/methylation domain-containing protein
VVAQLRARLAQEEGMTLPELLTSMAILSVVLTAIIGVFVSGLRAETNMNNRFQAQQNARLALTSLRNEIGSACSVSVPSTYSGSVLQLGEGCSDGVSASTVYWCAASANGSAPFSLYRRTTTNCVSGGGLLAGGVKRAASFETNAVFASPCPSGSTIRPAVSVSFVVDANLSSGRTYNLSDKITERNASAVTCP